MTPAFFVLGFPRSGTSALRLHLTCHRDLVIPPECSFLTWLEPRYRDWTDADLGTPRVDTFVRDVEGSRKFTTWRMSPDEVRARIDEAGPVTFADLAACVYQAYARHQGKPAARWGDKNNVHLTLVNRLDALYPAAQFVMIVRDVRDVLASVRDVNELSGDLQFRPELPSDAIALAGLWRDQNGLALDTLAAVAPGRYTVIRYEDLVTDPRHVLGSVVDFLGVGWDEGMLSAHEANLRDRLEPAETLPWKRLTLEPLTDDRLGRWRRSVPDIDARAAIAEAEPIFSRTGYRP
jgi:hypothetical protein